MLKKISYLSILIIAIWSFRASAQSYQTALGVRLGDPSGVTLQHYIGGNSALEGILGIGPNWFTLTGLYELHQPFSDPNGLGWYVGGGAHIGGLNGGYDYNNKHYNSGAFILGVDGILGIDYTIPSAPLNLSLDWKPAINLSPFAGFFGGEFGLSVRYTFNR
ncbi:MAG: hypothetical protein K6T34_00610 [Thermoflavifilum sp.]|nr:hypothetical protein [Thermoflavifilum sp.]